MVIVAPRPPLAVTVFVPSDQMLSPPSLPTELGETPAPPEPTVIVAKDPDYITMREEIFGPVMTIFVFEDSKFDETLELVDNTSEYANPIFPKKFPRVKIPMTNIIIETMLVITI